jgi:hypothetical protein
VIICLDYNLKIVNHLLTKDQDLLIEEELKLYQEIQVLTKNHKHQYKKVLPVKVLVVVKI